MIKNFETYINEDYFSKLANRKDNCEVRKENKITEELVRSFIENNCEEYTKSISFREENGETIVDVVGDFYLSGETKEIPFQFGKVTGEFNISWCENLTSLKGCPKEVSGDFGCHNCKNLKSLDCCPEKVGGDFYCFGCGKKFTKKEVGSLCDVKGGMYI